MIDQETGQQQVPPRPFQQRVAPPVYTAQPYPSSAPQPPPPDPADGLLEGVILGVLGGCGGIGLGLYAGNGLLDVAGFLLLIATFVGGYGILQYRLGRDETHHKRSLVTIDAHAQARALPVIVQTGRDIRVAEEHETTQRRQHKQRYRIEIKQLRHELEKLKEAWQVEEARIILLTPQRLIETLGKLQVEQLKILAEMRRMMDVNPTIGALIETVFSAMQQGTDRMGELHASLLDPAVQANPAALNAIQQEIAMMGATTAAVVAGFFQQTHKIKLPVEEVQK